MSRQSKRLDVYRPTVAPGHRELSGLWPTESGRLEAVLSRSLAAVVGGSLACVQATRQGHVIGAAEAEVEFSQQFSCSK